MNILSKEEFSKLSSQSLIKFEWESSEGETFRAEWELLNKELEAALSQHWVNINNSEDYEGDYMLSDDWNSSWLHSMGIYTDRMHCSKFISIIQSVLKNHSPKFMFCVACESEEELQFGDLIFLKGQVYARENELDYAVFQ